MGKLGDIDELETLCRVDHKKTENFDLIQNGSDSYVNKLDALLRSSQKYSKFKVESFREISLDTIYGNYGKVLSVTFGGFQISIESLNKRHGVLNKLEIEVLTGRYLHHLAIDLFSLFETTLIDVMCVKYPFKYTWKGCKDKPSNTMYKYRQILEMPKENKANRTEDQKFVDERANFRNGIHDFLLTKNAKISLEKIIKWNEIGENYINNLIEINNLSNNVSSIVVFRSSL